MINQLIVKLSQSSTKSKYLVISFDIDRLPFFEDYMYVRFSSLIGVLASSHYIAGWSFKINEKAKSISLQIEREAEKVGWAQMGEEIDSSIIFLE